MLYHRMRCFLEVADCLSFSTAARNLHISQQAVTKQISALEEELGLRLFYRTTRHVVLTPAGSILREDFSRINRQINDSVRRARELDASGQSVLRIGFLSALSREDVILPLAEFVRREYPDCQMDIRLQDFTELRHSLMDGKIDFCITTSNDWPMWPGVRVTVLRRKQFQVVFSRRHPLAKIRTLELSDLKDHTHLILPDENLLDGVLQWGRKIPCSRTVFCPDISTLMVRLALGEGFALLTKVIEGHDSPDLRYWDVPFTEAHAEIVCVCREDASEEVREILQRIRDEDRIRL